MFPVSSPLLPHLELRLARTSLSNSISLVSGVPSLSLWALMTSRSQSHSSVFLRLLQAALSSLVESQLLDPISPAEVFLERGSFVYHHAL
jgi:hypothetical protein